MTRMILALALLVFPRLAHAELKIAYVDLQRALEETEEGRQAKTKLKTDFEKKQKELDQRQEELKKMKGDLDKQAAILKPDALQSKQQELQQRLVSLQDTYMRLQKQLQEREAEETGRIFKKMSSVIAEIAKTEGVTYVLEKSTGILYAPPSLDLTNELIRKYNSSGTSGKSSK